MQCLGKDEPCPDGYFYESVSPKATGPLKPLAGKSICRKCHPLCKKCTASGFHSQVGKKKEIKGQMNKEEKLQIFVYIS